MKKKTTFIFIACLLFCTTYLSAQEAKTDSSQTPFRKGRWFTGLSGSIESNSGSRSSGNNFFSNGYHIEFFNGKFSGGRFLPGFRLGLARTSDNNEFTENESETLFAAPTFVKYLSDNSQGSVFISIAFGYVRFFQKSIIQNGTASIKEVTRGNGYGGEIGIGYSYAITDHLVFDLGVDINSFRVVANKSIDPSGLTIRENIAFGGILFSFGFNVILDKYFF
ncbi:hypothetical protein [uncultured Microscilla sp.]|uniref:hypothetical protein n=1 Tax=uncultured Microscilla sp. TaxID=432653 RepID=UPI0026272B03|nr:hypothetical protein [uncultured Microscilla sp.]